MAQYIGKDQTKEKILPVIIDLLKDDNSEVRLNCILAANSISKVILTEILTRSFVDIVASMTRDSQWSVRMAVIELIGSLSISFGRDTYQKTF